MEREKKARQEKSEAREEKVSDRRDYKLDKIEAQEEKALAVAAKRKWLAAIMGLGIVIYLLVSKGGGMNLGGILDFAKGFLIEKFKDRMERFLLLDFLLE